VDAARIHLVEWRWNLPSPMKPDACPLVVKLFHGSGYDDLVKLFQASFIWSSA
jgi:23S rRNA (uridine2552-2'-O)-methyltransferase